VAERPARAERGDRAVDDSRVDAAGAGEIEPELVDRARSETLDEHVGAADQAVEDLEPARRLEVEGEAFLVSIQRDEGGALAAPVGRRPRSGVVPAAWALDLDDFRAHVAEGLGTEGSSHVLGEIGDDDAFQRVRHDRESITAEPRQTGRLQWLRGLGDCF
jgi:hypothetical protein